MLFRSGPQGQFGLVPGSEPMLCVAGGSGLAPIKAVLEQAIAERQANRPLTIVFGARTHADLYGLDDIDQIRRQWGGRFRFVPWTMALAALYAGTLWALRGHLLKIPPADACRLVVQIIGGGNAILLGIAAWCVWSDPAEPVRTPAPKAP